MIKKVFFLSIMICTFLFSSENNIRDHSQSLRNHCKDIILLIPPMFESIESFQDIYSELNISLNLRSKINDVSSEIDNNEMIELKNLLKNEKEKFFILKIQLEKSIDILNKFEAVISACSFLDNEPKSSFKFSEEYLEKSKELKIKVRKALDTLHRLNEFDNSLIHGKSK